MSLNWNFQRGGGGAQTKNPPWGEYGSFLEQHIEYTRAQQQYSPFVQGR